MSKYELEIEELFDVLTDQRCTTYSNIADVSGWNIGKVSDVLATIRRPAIAEEWGWTVPHVQRGAGVHWFQVIALDGAPLDEEQDLEIRKGNISTLREVETKGLNQAHALRSAAKLIGGTKARQYRRAAQAFEGAAAMVGDIAEREAEVVSLMEANQAG